MDQTIVNKYQIKFINKILEFPIRGRIVTKVPHTTLERLDEFIIGWSNPSEIDELLLTDVNDAINGTRSEIENGSETISILIYNDKVVFYPDNDAVFSLPTLEFKEIMQGWRNFLLAPPIKGTKVQ